MGLLIFTTLAALYFLPTLIGMSRRNVGAIFFLNLFLGWTVIGWVVCMVWALTKEEIVAPVVVHVTAPVPACPACRAPMSISDVFCTRCGTKIAWAMPHRPPA